MDLLVENSINMTPYHYTANNPIIFIDVDGLDWFYYSKNGKDDPTWNWHEGSEYNTGVKDEDGNDVILQGVQAVVVFEGYTKEMLGTKTDHVAGEKDKSNQYLNGTGTISSNVTVYGPDGADDISEYTGYVNSSDPSAFGVVADGIYDGEYVNPGKGGALSSNWKLKGNVPARFGENPAFPDRNPGYLNGVYIHSVNSNGWAGTWNSNGTYKGVSQGCLLISRSQWADFNAQMSGVQDFKVQIKREIHPLTQYQFMKKIFPTTKR